MIARDRDVAVAGYQALRRCDGADLEVAHLYQEDAIDAVADGALERALGPAGVELHADTDVEPVREVNGVLQGVHEADVDPKGVGVLDREGDAERFGPRQHRDERASRLSAASSHVGGRTGRS